MPEASTAAANGAAAVAAPAVAVAVDEAVADGDGVLGRLRDARGAPLTTSASA